jgi:hypothetical protein
MADGISKRRRMRSDPLYVRRFSEYSERSDDRLNTTNLLILFTVQNTCLVYHNS